MAFTHDYWINRVLPVWRQIGGRNGGWHEGGEYVGIGIGQVWKSGKTVYNLFVEPQWSVADKGAGYPRWQVFAGFNMQFKR